MKRLAIFLAFVLLPFVAGADVTSARVTAYDWQCVPSNGASPSNHQRFDLAFIACVNQGGGIVQGGQYKVAASAGTPAPTTTTTRINWTAPAIHADGTPITAALSYRIEVQSGTTWTPVATVSGLSYDAPGSSGCWRIVAIEGASQSAPTNQVCR
jgi:hypothetical protein